MSPREMDSIFETKILEVCSNFVECCGVVIFEVVLYFWEG